MLEKAVKGISKKIISKALLFILPPIIMFFSLLFLLIIIVSVVSENSQKEMLKVMYVKDLPASAIEFVYDEHMNNRQIGFIELLAYEGTLLGGNWSKYKKKYGKRYIK